MGLFDRSSTRRSFIRPLVGVGLVRVGTLGRPQNPAARKPRLERREDVGVKILLL